mgnify:CR=1 FL=1
MIIYELFSRLSYFFSEPFINIANNTEGIPLLSAFVLGIVGAMAPCQFTGNLGAITIYGNRSIQKGLAWSEVLYFILGKIFVFSSLGLIVWYLGQEFQQSLTQYFPVFRKLIGPMLIFIGLFMIGIIKLQWKLSILKLPNNYFKEGKLGAFLMGLSFSLAFCPTMFVLFFLTLMPLVLASSFGLILPSVFAVGTSIPLIAVILLVWYFGLSGTFMKKGRKIGAFVQKSAGWVMIVLGILDTITYWTI